MRLVLTLAAASCALMLVVVGFLLAVASHEQPARTSSEAEVSFTNENPQHLGPATTHPASWRSLPPALVARLRCPDPVCDPPPAPPPECDATKAQERYEDAPEGSQYMLEHQVRICLDGRWTPWVGIGDDDEEETTESVEPEWSSPVVEFVIDTFTPFRVMP